MNVATDFKSGDFVYVIANMPVIHIAEATFVRRDEGHPFPCVVNITSSQTRPHTGVMNMLSAYWTRDEAKAAAAKILRENIAALQEALERMES